MSLPGFILRNALRNKRRFVLTVFSVALRLFLLALLQVVLRYAVRRPVLEALRAGQYSGVKGELRLPSNGVLTPAQLREFDRVHSRSHRMRGWMTQTKRWMEGIGLRVPGSVKTQLRRIF